MTSAEYGDLLHLAIAELAPLIEAREVSPVELAQAQIDRIAARDGDLHAYAHVTATLALRQAEAAEAEIGSGHYRGPLHGVPVAVKDLFWTKNVPTAAGMAIHREFRPEKDATVVRRLRDAGAVLLGKLQMTEGAYSDYHPSIVPPRNPWNAAYWAGISSSGPAVAASAGLCYGALASDTGGSIRWPAAANGVTGLKPSWGRVSRHGTFALAPTLDHVGPIARSATDTGILLAAIAGPDPLDPTARRDTVPGDRTRNEVDLRGVRIGVDPDWNGSDVDEAVQAVLAEACAAFAALGSKIVDVRAPDTTQSVVDWVPNCAVEAAVVHVATYPARKDDYGPILAAVIEAGQAVSGRDLHEIQLRRLNLRGRFDALFETIDLLLTPVHPFSPPTLVEIGAMGTQPDLIARLQRYTCPFDMTGSPTITLPGGAIANGMPIAFQLVAADFREATLVRAGAAFQSTTHWHERRPFA